MVQAMLILQARRCSAGMHYIREFNNDVPAHVVILPDTNDINVKIARGFINIPKQCSHVIFKLGVLFGNKNISYLLYNIGFLLAALLRYKLIWKKIT